MAPRRALLLLIGCSAALRLIWASSVGLGHDEAYHYLFTVHPDWSYFDHPPMLAWIEAVGPIMSGSTEPWSLRLGFIILFSGSTWLMFRLTQRTFGDRAAVFAAIALNISAYHTAAAGAFALPDGPLLFFWLLTLDRIDIALKDERATLPWIWVGLGWGGALLSKYHAIFLPAGLVAYIVFTPGTRKLLLKPGPYFATAIGLIMFTPVLFWNAQHDWASFVFQGGRAVANSGFKPLSLLGSFAGQAAYLFPWIWFAMLVAIYDGFRRIRQGDATQSERFLLWMTITPLLLFSVVASLRVILPHWTLVAYLSTYPMVGRLWASWLDRSPVRFRKRLVLACIVPVVVAVVVVIQYHWGIIPVDRFVKKKADAVRADPTAELFGWDDICEALKSRGLLDPDRTFLFTSLWYQSGHLGHATRTSGVQVTCYNPNDARGFAFWSKPAEWLGRDGILVTFQDPTIEPACFKRYFSSIEPAGELPIIREGHFIRTAYFYRCRAQSQPFPFEYKSGPKRPPLQRLAESEVQHR